MADKKLAIASAVYAGCLFLCTGLVSSSSHNDHALKAVFSMGGIKGDVIFSQPQVNGPTSVIVKLTGVNETLMWSIKELPMIYDGNAALSCNASAVGAVFDPEMAMKAADYATQCTFSSISRFQACAVGDLGNMLGNITRSNAEMNHTGQNLVIPTRGPHSIMGRTLVLYSGDTPKACALIRPNQHMITTAVAVFKAPVAGFIYLRQVNQDSDTSIFVDLFFVNDAQSSNQFTWKINQGVVDVDSSDQTTYCKTLGEGFNPTNSNGENCNQTMHDSCPIGDLSSKHGNVIVSLATPTQSQSKVAFTDTNLPLSGANSVIGKTIVLISVSDPGKPIACAKIMTLKRREFEVSFEAPVNDGVSGSIKFTQASPFDPTTSVFSLSGLAKKAEGYHIHAYPSPEYKHLSAKDSCSGLVAGDHWNPFNINIKTSPPAGTGTDDEYEIGDLSGKYGSFLNLTDYSEQHEDYNLPLFGRYSIQGRSLVIHKLKKDGNKRWVCNNVMPVNDAGTLYFMKASANFTGPALSGVILMDQYFSSEENTAAVESTIFVDINTTQEVTGNYHMWDVRSNPVGDDATAADSSKRCQSLDGQFNPYKVFTEGNYNSACGLTNLLRCQSGDMTKKHGVYMVGDGRQLYNDVNLPLFGHNSVVGHGIVLHRQGSIGCANIEADSSLFVEKSLEFVKDNSFSKAYFADVVSKALNIPKWRLFNIHTEKAENDKCQIVKFGIIGKGNQLHEPERKFNEVLNSNPDAFDKYRPSVDCAPETSGARRNSVDIYTLGTVVMATLYARKLKVF